MMVCAYVSGWDLDKQLDADLEDLTKWVEEAYKLHNHLNEPPKT